MVSVSDRVFLYRMMLRTRPMHNAVLQTFEHVKQKNRNINETFFKKELYKQAIVYDNFIHNTFPQLRMHSPNSVTTNVCRRKKRDMHTRHTYCFRPSTYQSRNKIAQNNKVEFLYNNKDDDSVSHGSQHSSDSEWVPSECSDHNRLCEEED